MEKQRDADFYMRWLLENGMLALDQDIPGKEKVTSQEILSLSEEIFMEVSRRVRESQEKRFL